MREAALHREAVQGLQRGCGAIVDVTNTFASGTAQRRCLDQPGLGNSFMMQHSSGQPPKSTPKKGLTFDQFLNADPRFPERVRAKAHEHTRSSSDRMQPELVYDLTMRDVERQWATIRDVDAFLNFVVPRHAAKLRRKKRVIKTMTTDPEIQRAINADLQERSKPDLLLKKAEEDYVLKAYLGLNEMDQVVLYEFANSKSSRESAARLGIAEATFRIRLRNIIEKIQPPPGLRDGD